MRICSDLAENYRAVFSFLFKRRFFITLETFAHTVSIPLYFNSHILVNKENSTGSKYAGTFGSASHRYEVFYCRLWGSASAVVVLPGRHIKYMVNICKKKAWFLPFFFFFILKEAFAVSEKAYDFSSACCPDGIVIMFSPKRNSNLFPLRKNNWLQEMAGSSPIFFPTYYSW